MAAVREFSLFVKVIIGSVILFAAQSTQQSLYNFAFKLAKSGKDTARSLIGFIKKRLEPVISAVNR